MILRDIAERMLATIGLIAGAPILIAAAAAIVFEDGPPVFFRQRRVGKAGVLFELKKLRSMRVCDTGPGITASGDRRITRVGRFIRKYKIDELPQLWNVVRGDMLLIGPRPELPKFVDGEDPLWREVLGVKPGITNATTLLFREEEAMLAGQPDPEQHYRREVLPLKLKLHAREIKQQTLLGDVEIVLITLYYSAFPARLDAEALKQKLFAVAEPA